MFRISEIEWKNMSSQFVTTSRVKRPKAALPYAFTEQGVAMLSAVLRSGMAIQVSISIMKAFVAMRNYITTATTVTSELAEIRAKLALLERADEDNAEAVNDLSEDMRRELDNIYEAIAALSVKVPEARKKPRPIGFKLPKDLAALYQVETRVLKQAVRRNIERFPGDFMLRLSADEANRLINIGRSQNVIPPDYNIGSTEMFAFTEEGVAMLSAVLKSLPEERQSLCLRYHK